MTPDLLVPSHASVHVPTHETILPTSGRGHQANQQCSANMNVSRMEGQAC